MKQMNKSLLIAFMLFLIAGGTSVVTRAQATNPTQQQTKYWRTNGKCSDPWVSMAVYNGVTHASTSNGSDGECDVMQYNSGQWNNYAELLKGVDAAKADMRASGLKWDAYTAGRAKALFLLGSDDKIIFARLIGNDGGTLVGNDGASFKAIINKLVAAGGGNVVPTGAGRLKALGLIGTDSAGILSNANAGMLSIVKFTPSFVLKSVGGKTSYKIGTARYVIK
ncbi:hypothetical protein BH10ACI3_BH10ACI3_09250 [soil metagenome]